MKLIGEQSLTFDGDIIPEEKNASDRQTQVPCVMH